MMSTGSDTEVGVAEGLATCFTFVIGAVGFARERKWFCVVFNKPGVTSW